MTARPVAATCGESPTSRSLGMTAERLGGCGEPIATCAEVYRCVDCDVPFHRGCARRHFSVSKDEKDARIEQLERRVAELGG